MTDKFTLIQFQRDPYSPALGSLYLAHGLEKEGVQFDLKIYPLYKYMADLDKLYSFLAESGDILGIGCWSHMLPPVIAVLDKLKEKFPGKTIILGGVGPTEVAEEILNKFKFIDFVIKGCGVYTLPRLIKSIKNGDDELHAINGLVYRNKDNVVSNPYGGFHLNIPERPAYHRIGHIRGYSVFSIFTSFGCPYKCTYCDTRPASSKKVIYRDLNQVIDEIKLIKRIKKQKDLVINILDEAFVINKERVIKFCNLLKSEKIGIRWFCYGRVDTMDEELLKSMGETGCESLYYGIESGSNGILRKVKKGFTIEEAIKVLLLSKKYIKSVTASFIFLYPFEKPEDFVQTKLFLRYLISKKIETQLFALCPVKHSEVYREYRKDLVLSEDILSICNCRIRFDNMPRECIKLIKDNPDIFYYYYSYDFKDADKIIEMALGPRKDSEILSVRK
jgi:radical SAM superfamily enzyme YgiQ (UPF0313 family)